MSAETRYYYVDAQNQAAGPIAMAGLMALKTAGTVTDATLVVAEGGTEWVAFSSLKAEGASQGGAGTLQSSVPAPSGVRNEGGHASAGTAGALPSSSAERVRSEGGSSPAEPLWASQLSQKIDQLTAAMDKLTAAMDKSRPAPGPVLAPATAALHAEKINLNPAPKPGLVSQVPATAAPALRPTPLPAGVPVAAPRVAGPARPGASTTLSPLAVPANAQKSALPLPALGKAPGPAPAPAAAKGNIFSKFLKK